MRLAEMAVTSRHLDVRAKSVTAKSASLSCYTCINQLLASISTAANVLSLADPGAVTTRQN